MQTQPTKQKSVLYAIRWEGGSDPLEMNCLRVSERNTKQVMRVLDNGWMGGNLQLEVQSTHFRIDCPKTHPPLAINSFYLVVAGSVSLAQLVSLKNGSRDPKEDEAKTTSVMPANS